MTPSLAAPLSKALIVLPPPANFEAYKAAVLTALRADPAVRMALGEALHGIDVEDDRHIARVLDALFGTFGAGPISSGEAAG